MITRRSARIRHDEDGFWFEPWSGEFGYQEHGPFDSLQDLMGHVGLWTREVFVPDPDPRPKWIETMAGPQ